MALQMESLSTRSRAREDVGIFMSLVGNLEDLSLGDLLQIVSLSQKSGVLVLESVTGSGQIVFRAGLVHAAGIKGRTPDLRGVLVCAGLLDGASFDAALEVVGAKAPELPARLATHVGLDRGAVEALIRKTTEAAIFEFFAWEVGNFSFDARGDEGDIDRYAYLENGLNAQYLAMEGMRLRDEQARSGPAPEIELSDEIFFGSDSLETDSDPDLELEPEIVAGSMPTPSDPERRREAVDRVVERVVVHSDASPPEEPAQPSPAAVSIRPLVVIEPDAVALEWIKSAIEGKFARIHVFQRAEQGLARIRQYLIRGEVPFVLIALSAPIDSLSGIHGLPDFVKRLRSQSPRIVVVGLREESLTGGESVPPYLDAVLAHPTRRQLNGSAASDLWAKSEGLARDLGRILSPPAERPGSAPAPASTPVKALAARVGAFGLSGGESDNALATAQSQNEVFAVVLNAAASLFVRAVVLVVRDRELFAVAGRGIAALEVDPLSTSSRLSCPLADTGLVRQVVSEQRPLHASLRSEADRLLTSMFGPIEPKAAYLAPIRVAGGGLAVLYADQASTRRAAPDTAALERLLEEAADVLETIDAHRVEGEARSTPS